MPSWVHARPPICDQGMHVQGYEVCLARDIPGDVSLVIRAGHATFQGRYPIASLSDTSRWQQDGLGSTCKQDIRVRAKGVKAAFCLRSVKDH